MTVLPEPPAGMCRYAKSGAATRRPGPVARGPGRARQRLGGVRRSRGRWHACRWWFSPAGRPVTSAVERAAALDAPAEAIDALVSESPTGPVKDLLSGCRLRDPLPGPGRRPDRRLLRGRCPRPDRSGAVGRPPGRARPAQQRPGRRRRTHGLERPAGPNGGWGLAHLALNVAGLGVIAASWLSRRKDPGRGVFDSHGPWLTLTGFGIVGASAWLGGRLAYAMGVGVDTTAFQRPPTRWTDTIAVSELVEGQPVTTTVGSTTVLLLRNGGGSTPSPTGAPTVGVPCTRNSSGRVHRMPLAWKPFRPERRCGRPRSRDPSRAGLRDTGHRRSRQIRRDEVRTLRLNPVG